MYEVEQTDAFGRWEMSIKDKKARLAIHKRIRDIAATGQLLGDWQSVGDGVFELRFHSGPGYRVYLARRGFRLILLLMGGTKQSQQRDIAYAKQLWNRWKEQHGSRIF